jgi:ssDNA-binding Zn-finger/Zn-ribbon topoisomerase 1
MGIFDLFRKKNSKDSEVAQGKSHLNVGIIDIWENEREEFENYFKFIKRPIEESLILSSEFFKNSICPYCGFKLDKSPLKKTKCPNCHNYIYVRTNLITKEKMLLTEEQVNKLENERDEIGTKLGAEKTALSDYYIWIEFKKTKGELKKENKKMEDFDIIWGILDKKEIEYTKQNNWGLFRCSLYGKFMILNAEKKFQDAIRMILEVCYYDINGPNNVPGIDFKMLNKKGTEYDTEYIKQNWGLFKKPGELDKMLKKYGDTLQKENKALEAYYYNKTGPKPSDNELVESFLSQPFDLRFGCVYSGLIFLIKELKEKLNLQWNDVKNMFIERASRVRMNIMLVPPQEAWDILYDELYDGLE